MQATDISSSSEKDQDSINGPTGSSQAATSDSPFQNEGEKEEAWKQEKEQLEAQIKEKNDKYLYLYAEFETFKKRSIKERLEWMKFGWEPVARELLQCVDNLERALIYTPVSMDPAFLTGIQQTLSHFTSALAKQGVEAIPSAGKPFDPQLHEAIAQVPSELPQGMIVQELQKGYTLHGRLLRPSQVQVSSGK